MRRPAHTYFGVTLLTALLLALAAAAALGQGFHVLGPGGHTGPTSASGPLLSQNLCPNEPPPYIHWDLRQFPGGNVPFEINPAIPPDPAQPGLVQPGQAAVIAAVRAAAARWSAVTPSHVRLLDVSTPTLCPQGPQQDGSNCVSWSSGFPFHPTLAALTYLWRDAGSGVLRESDISLSPFFHWQNTAPSAGCPRTWVEAFMVHEFGHFVGLHHPNEFSNAVCGNDDPTGATRMFSLITDPCAVRLTRPDRDGISFLYSWDLGDAEDPSYPSLVRDGGASGQTLSGVGLQTPGDGAAHLFGHFGFGSQGRYQYEWLALGTGAVDGGIAESEALVPDADSFDDGVAILAECEADQTLAPPVNVLIGVATAADLQGRTHVYDSLNRMHLNGWFDWNDDGDFDDNGEHAIGAASGGVAVSAAGVYGFQLTAPDDTPCEVHSRFRLDWGEDSGQLGGFAVDATLSGPRGAAQNGEVEDYVGLYEDEPWDPWWPAYCHGESNPLVPFSGIDMRLFHLCHPPAPDFGNAGAGPGGPFPQAGSECMDSTLTFGLDADLDGVIDEYLGLAGPVCVSRSDPYTDAEGLRAVDTEMLSLEMSGHSQLAGAIEIRLAPGQPTLGRIAQTPEAQAQGVDFSYETPADSWFDVYVVVETEELGLSGVVGPLRATASLAAVPPGKPNGITPGVVVGPGVEPTVIEPPISIGIGIGGR